MRSLLFIILTLGMLNVYGQKKPDATEANVSYGDHKRNKMDFWKAESSEPSPVIIYFHGGGFTQGDKSNIHWHIPVNEYLQKGVSCISINYPFKKHVGGSHHAIFQHCENAVKYIIKEKAASWNIDTKRMSVSGSSAGALISQSLGFKGKYFNAMGTFDQPMGTSMVVSLIKRRKTPPMMLYQKNPLSDKVHHPKYAKLVKVVCDKQKVECLLYGTGNNGIPKLPNGKSSKEVMMEFFLEKWGMK